MADPIVNELQTDVWNEVEEWAKQVLASYSIIRVDRNGNIERPKHFDLHDLIGKCLRVCYQFPHINAGDGDMYQSERCGILVLKITGVQVHCWANGARKILLDVAPCGLPSHDEGIHEIRSLTISIDSSDATMQKVGIARHDIGDQYVERPFHFNRARFVSVAILWY